MNDGLRFTDDVAKTFKKTKTAMFVTIGVCLAVCMIVVFLSYQYTSLISNKIYVVDDGSVLEAERVENKAQRDLEVIDHVTRFHDLFFNLIPSNESIKYTVDRALEMSDKSAYAYYKQLEETQYFTRLVNINATQQIQVDTVLIDMNHYPYLEKTYATITVVRSSNVSKYNFISTGKLFNVTRTKKNPHGLVLRNFEVKEFRKTDSQER